MTKRVILNTIKSLLIGLAVVWLLFQKHGLYLAVSMGLVAAVYFFIIFQLTWKVSDQASLLPVKKYKDMSFIWLFTPQFLLVFSLIFLLVIVVLLLLKIFYDYNLSIWIVFLPFLEAFFIYFLLLNLINYKNRHGLGDSFMLLYTRLKKSIVIFVLILFFQLLLLAYFFSFDQRILLMGIGIIYFCFKIYWRYMKGLGYAFGREQMEDDVKGKLQ